MRAKLRLLSLALVAATIAFAGTASARPFNEFIGFGDSTIDSGWFIYQPPPSGPNGPFWIAAIANGGGKPTTPFGLMVSEVLAAHFGLTAFPADQPSGGTNYAASGAQNNAALINPRAPSVVQQIATYLGSVQGAANSRALYLISSGGNDITFALDQFHAGSFTLAQAQNYVITAANDLITAIEQLVAAGARTLIIPAGFQVVPADPNYSASPFAFNAIYRTALYTGLSGHGIRFIPADRTVVSSAIGLNPAAFGFQFVLTTQVACINPSPSTILRRWSAYCTPSLLVSPDAAQTYLFADNEHYTAAGQKLLAGYYVSLVESVLKSCADDQDGRRGRDRYGRPDSVAAPTTICELWTSDGASDGATTH